MNTKQLQLVTFEQAKRLNALGFDWPVDYYYHENDKKDDTPITMGRLTNFNEEGYHCYSAPTVALTLEFMQKKTKTIIYSLSGVDLDGIIYYKHLELRDENEKIIVYFGNMKKEYADRRLLDNLLTILEMEEKQ